MIVSRRYFLSFAAAALCLPAAARSAALMNDDGLYTQPWFLESFLVLGDDLQEAAAAGKRLVVIWEQKGCSYCKDLHLVNFAQPQIADFVRENFAVLQLNLFGSRKVTDFDGEVLEERALAKKYAISFTPTVQFFPARPEDTQGKRGKAVEAARMPGYLKPPEFLAMFRYVRDRAYERQDFQSYLKSASQRS